MVRLLIFIAAAMGCGAATFGTVTPLTGGAVDIVLDAGRQRLYLVGVPNKVEVYSIPQRRFLTSITTDSLPLAAAISRDGRSLYVACHNAATVNVIDLETLGVVNRISLPSRPEGIAVGGDNRVLITTIGTGVNNAQNTLLLYDPALTDSRNLTSLTLTPPTPASPGTSPTGQLIQTNRSFLATSNDGRYIIGVNIPNTTTRAVFVYEVESATMLRSRTVNNISSVLSVSPDGGKFMAGLNLFETETLAVLGQQNLANAPYPIAAAVNFNVQQNQGGSVFSPDGRLVYSAFNIAPTQNPPARANVGQLQISDADNLLITMGVQMPENLSGKMVITPDGGTIFAISESGFVTIPIGQLRNQPLAMPERTTVLLANDQCGVTASQRRATVRVRNEGAGRLTATAQILTNVTGTAGVGGAGGPGGGAPGGGIIVVPLPGGPITIPAPPIGVPVGGNPNQPNNPAVVNASPTVQNANTADGPVVTFGYNSTNTSLGSTAPTSFLVQSPEAVNIPALVRVNQNNRDAEARGLVVPIDTGISVSEGLVDIVYDSTRRRIYIANSGLNRVEVFDERAGVLQAPIKVGQLPRSLALSADNSLLYVANSSSEYITVIDLQTGRQAGRITLPPLPVLANVPLVYPSQIVSTQRGLLVVMNNGSLWTTIGNQLLPRATWNILGTGTLSAPRTMAATPNGEYAIVMNGNGIVYLYDAIADEIVQSRQIFTGTQLQGYYGPITAGPRGAYYVVNGTVLNQALTPVSTFTAPGQTATATIPAVAAVGNNQYARFSMPIRANATAAVNAVPAVELVNTDTGQVLRRLNALEGPLAQVVGNQRTNIDGRTMVVDGTGTNAYVITTTGLSVVNLEAISLADRPTISNGGTVSLGSYTTDIAAGGIVSIFGRSFGGTATGSGSPLPTLLNGVCVTLNNQPLPLFSTSAGQINAAIPFERTAGTFQLVVRDTNRRLASVPQTVRVVAAAPSVLVDPGSGQAAIYDQRGQAVNEGNPTTRDQRLVIYALGLGPTRGTRVAAGAASPASPPAEIVGPIKVFFGDKRYSQAEVIVEWAGLTPGFVGLYQINVYVPGDRMRGDDLDVTIRVGTVENKFLPALRPTVAVR
ncbi:MAG: hypothetical protein ACK532_21135 [Acidobacteriota bacterium]